MVAGGAATRVHHCSMDAGDTSRCRGECVNFLARTTWIGLAPQCLVVTDSLTHPLTHSLTRTLAHSHTHSLTRPLTHSLLTHPLIHPPTHRPPFTSDSQNTTTVRWIGVRGSSYTGDIAVDSITIRDGVSLPPTVAPTPTPPCPPQEANAAFRVTFAAPVQTCSGQGGPQADAEGTCFATSSGMCVTDGGGR